MKVGNWYKFKAADADETHIGQYVGTGQGFECCVCGKGHCAFEFNVWYDGDSYETWGFGKRHVKIVEDLGTSESPIID